MTAQTEHFRRKHFDFGSLFFTSATGLATFLIIAILAVILGNILYHGSGAFSWRFVSGGTQSDMFDVHKAGVFPMIFGTTALVVLMTLFVVPIGVITAIYLTEYAPNHSRVNRFIR